jgi:hypothetical protein
MALPAPAQVRLVEERYGSWDEGCAEAERRSEMDTAHIWGRDMSYAEKVWAILAPEFGPQAPPTKHGAGRYGKDYSGQTVEEVVRQASAAQEDGENLGRTLRDKLAAEVDGVTAYAVDLIFAEMKAETLAPGPQAGWLKIDGEFSPTPEFINLHDRATRLAERNSSGIEPEPPRIY